MLSLTHSLTHIHIHTPLPAIAIAIAHVHSSHCDCGVCIVYAVCALCMRCVHCVCGVCRQQVRGLIWFIERPLIWADDWLEATAIAARANSAGMFKGLLPRPV